MKPKINKRLEHKLKRKKIESVAYSEVADTTSNTRPSLTTAIQDKDFSETRLDGKTFKIDVLRSF